MIEESVSIRKSIRRSAYVSLAGVVIFLAALSYSSFHLYMETNKVDTLSKRIASLTNEAKAIKKTDDSLSVHRDSLTKSILNLINLQGEIGTSNKHDQNNQQLNRAINSLILVGLSGFNVDSAAFNSVKNNLQQTGYTVTNAVIFPKHEKWLATQCEVFYYDKKMAPLAEKLAQSLTKLTGKLFSTDKGAGFGVLKGEESFTLKVDYINFPVKQR